ncbi:hypothetical protein ACFDR9_000324 [Janthinobacterium sp. CG_23.3]|uniref:hypothetical protein n=1 Tax=unclassified Janthinobacterium TaxID=2610881 RepID=UPI0003461001|nr:MULTISPECIES: hypothetical protein [unclassified Janthinobacterium]MEC5160995.1 hypothetical protein [Janthinobacterium sp. CG_S6]
MTFDLRIINKRVSAALAKGSFSQKIPTKTHFFTQLPTLEDAKRVVKRFPSIETVILLMK